MIIKVFFLLPFLSNASEITDSRVIHGFGNTTILLISDSADAKKLFESLNGAYVKTEIEDAKSPLAATLKTLVSSEELNASSLNEKTFGIPRWKIRCKKVASNYSCEILIKEK